MSSHQAEGLGDIATLYLKGERQGSLRSALKPTGLNQSLALRIKCISPGNLNDPPQPIPLQGDG